MQQLYYGMRRDATHRLEAWQVVIVFTQCGLRTMQLGLPESTISIVPHYEGFGAFSP